MLFPLPVYAAAIHPLPPLSAPSGLLQGVVTLSFDDGFTSQYEEAFPVLKDAGLPATFYIITDKITPTVSEYDVFSDPNEKIDQSTTSHGVVWSAIYTDPSAQRYLFSDTYTSDGNSTVVVSYVDSDGKQVTRSVADLPPGSAKKVSADITLPTTKDGKTITPIVIAHTNENGSLTASDPSLREYDTDGLRYMNAQQVMDLQASGEEVSAHTKTHPNLTTLNVTDARNEIEGSRDALVEKGIKPVSTFAYPDDDYNPQIEAMVSIAGFSAARTTDEGYNGKDTDPFALKAGNVEEDTTFASVKSWIDSAVQQHAWLILVFHQIESAEQLKAEGAIYGTTPEVFSQIVDYLKSRAAAGKLKVETLSDAAQLLSK